MDGHDIINISQDCIGVLLKVALPILITALVVGLIISLIQAMTQIQEQTLAFVPKLVCIALVILLSLSHIGKTMGDFSTRIMSAIIHIK